MNTQHSIPCPTPNCGGKIVIDTHQLLLGHQFVCPNCQGSVGLAEESREVVKDTINKFDAMKQELLQKKKELSNQ